MKNWTELDEKLFDAIKVRFPVEDELTIIHGLNGNYKTYTAEALARYYKNKGENVLFFPTFRILTVTKEQIDSAIVMNKLAYENFFNQMNLSDALRGIEREFGDYINRGTTQLLNFLTNIIVEEDATVIIDTPEVNLDMYAKRNFVDAIQSLENVKRLILITHQPEIIEDKTSTMINIEQCLDKGNGYGRGWKNEA